MIDAIFAALGVHGLILRGGINFAVGEDRPNGPCGRPARSLLLVGTAGAGYWPHFFRWRAAQPADIAEPLDTWSRTVIGEVASGFDGRLVMPNDRPYTPFQQWAMRAEKLKPSPLGILIHPRYGLWHAYRAAILFDVEISIQHAEKSIHACDLCAGKPCLKACPVGAYSVDGFASDVCLSHVKVPAGTICREYGCLARNACPVGAEWRYPIDVQAFHQEAFAGF